MKDIVTPVPQDDVKAVIRRCLEQAALVNYQRLSEYAKIEGRLLAHAPCCQLHWIKCSLVFGEQPNYLGCYPFLKNMADVLLWLHLIMAL